MTLQMHSSGVDEYPKYARILVGGSSGVGKTRFALTAKNPLWVSASPGMATLSLHSGVRYVDIQTEDQLFELKNILLGDHEVLNGPVETLVVDTVDELQRRMLQGKLAKERRTDIRADDWNWIAQRMDAVFKGLNELPMHIIYITHLKEMGGFDDSVTVKPNIQGGFAEQIHSHVDGSFWIRSNGSANLSLDVVLSESHEPWADKDKTPSEDKLLASVPTWTDKRYMFTSSTAAAEWVHDHTNTLPAIFDLNFSDDFPRMLYLREQGCKDIADSSVADISLQVDAVEEDTTTQEAKPLVVKEESVPGMSSNDDIQKLLKLRKANKQTKDTTNYDYTDI